MEAFNINPSLNDCALAKQTEGMAESPAGELHPLSRHGSSGSRQGRVPRASRSVIATPRSSPWNLAGSQPLAQRLTGCQQQTKLIWKKAILIPEGGAGGEKKI